MRNSDHMNLDGSVWLSVRFEKGPWLRSQPRLALCSGYAFTFMPISCHNAPRLGKKNLHLYFIDNQWLMRYFLASPACPQHASNIHAILAHRTLYILSVWFLLGTAHWLAQILLSC